MAEKRSEFLVRGEDTPAHPHSRDAAKDHSDSETQQRKLAAGLRQSFDRSVDQSMESLPSRASAAPSQLPRPQAKPQSQNQGQSNRAPATATALASARSVGESWESTDVKMKPKNGLRSSQDDSSRLSPNPASSRVRRSTDSTAQSVTASTNRAEAVARESARDSARSLASSTTSLHTTDTRDSMMPGPEQDLNEIDKRIQALNSYLESAR